MDILPLNSALISGEDGSAVAAGLPGSPILSFFDA
jgi:hypothetical protein